MNGSFASELPNCYLRIISSSPIFLNFETLSTQPQMEGAFAAGYDPALEVGKLHHKKHPHHPGSLFEHEMQESDDPSDPHSHPHTNIVRKEQQTVDGIVKGENVGNYWILMGPKGTGKKHTIIESMRGIHADGAAFAEAHGDLEVFRLRLGKALHYEFK